MLASRSTPRRAQRSGNVRVPSPYQQEQTTCPTRSHRMTRVCASGAPRSPRVRDWVAHFPATRAPQARSAPPRGVTREGRRRTDQPQAGERASSRDLGKIRKLSKSCTTSRPLPAASPLAALLDPVPRLPAHGSVVRRDSKRHFHDSVVPATSQASAPEAVSSCTDSRSFHSCCQLQQRRRWWRRCCNGGPSMRTSDGLWPRAVLL